MTPSDFAVSAKSDGVIGRLGLGQEALSEGNGSCGASSLDFAVSAKSDGVIGRLGVGQEALSEATVLVALVSLAARSRSRPSMVWVCKVRRWLAAWRRMDGFVATAPIGLSA